MATVLGQGTAVQNTFAAINWANTTKFLQVEVDLGNGYVDLGTQQLMSVPYAMYAANGPAGPQGPAGADGAAGATGPQGPAGQSAYEIWLSLGNIGSELDFINSLSMNTNGALLSNLPNISLDSYNFNTTGISVDCTLLPGPSASSYGFVWDTLPNPTIYSNVVYGTNALPTFHKQSNFSKHYNTAYYIRAFAANDFGVNYTNEISFVTGQYVTGDIGPGGGLIFYDKGYLSDGWRYLEAGPTTIGSYAFGCQNLNIPNAISGEIGDGLNATNAILASCNEVNNAANAASNYTNNGKSDWFVPSKMEAYLMFQNLKLNGLGNSWGNMAYYTTSTQSSTVFTGLFTIWSNTNIAAGGDGIITEYQPNGKNDALSLKPIRRF
jgi:hypothetical protein